MSQSDPVIQAENDRLKAALRDVEEMVRGLVPSTVTELILAALAPPTGGVCFHCSGRGWIVPCGVCRGTGKMYTVKPTELP